MITLHTPYRHSRGAGLSLSVARPVPPLIGAGRDYGYYAGVHQFVVGVGLWWLFLTVSFFWWSRA